LGIHFTVRISCERAAPFAEENAAVRHHVLRSLISLYNEHSVYVFASLGLFSGSTIDTKHTKQVSTFPLLRLISLMCN
jgi:hypothetical protein